MMSRMLFASLSRRSQHEALYAALIEINEGITTMTDALAGIAADETSLAASVPALVQALTDAQAAQAAASAALAAQIALGVPVNPTELAAIQQGLDTAAAAATAALPAPPVPGTVPPAPTTPAPA